MYLATPITIEDHILRILKTGPKTTLFLIDRLNTLLKHKRPTKQAIYKSLRKLKREQVITITHSTVTLHDHFLESLADYIQTAQQNTQKSLIDDSILKLSAGEKIMYHFSTVEKADIFWAHLFSLLINTLNKHTPLYTYEPHNWFILSSRKTSEHNIIKKMHKEHIPYLITIGHTTPLDLIAKKEYAITPNIQYHNELKPSLGKNNYHLNIFGDIILETWTDKKAAEKIHKFFMEHKELTDDARQVLESFIHLTGKTRIVISNNKKRAELLKKKLNKYFYLPKTSPTST